MIVVNKALESLKKKVNRSGLGCFGAGFLEGVALQFERAAKGMRLVAISNRTLGNAFKAYEDAEAKEIAVVTSQYQIDTAIKENKSCITTDPN